MNNSTVLKKKLLASSVAAVLSMGVAQTAQADIYYFTFSNGGLPGSCVDAPDPALPGVNLCPQGDGFFTMLTSTGVPLGNTSNPYYDDISWNYGLRTQIGGSITVDPTNGTGVASINPFEFFNGNSPAVASDITMTEIDADPNSNGTMWLGNMLFGWNSIVGIPVSIVWDMQGLIGALNGPNTTTITNVGATPASNAISKGSIPIGAAPIATTIWNTSTISGAAMGTNPSGETPIIVDGASIGGSPMIAGPFEAFNANFDFKTLTFAGYNDTTRPVLSLGSTTLNLTVGDSFNPNAPGVSVTCLDNADGSDNLTAAVGTNPNISFTVNNGNGGAAVDTGTPGSYQVLYTCTDNASARAAIADDPNIAGVQPTVPANNTSVSTTILAVNVVGAGVPAITITGGTPTSHEACTTYTDAGATALDTEDGDLTSSIVVTDVNSIIGTAPNEGSYAIEYDVTDSNSNVAATQTRTVNAVDTVAPVLSVIGGSTINIESSACAGYVKPQATVVDANSNCNAPVTSPVSTSSTINCTVPSGQDTIQSTLLYSADDTSAATNTGTTSATVTVSRSEPVITLNGGGVVLNVGDAYTELGMDIHDVQDGDVNDVTASGSSSGLTYTITSNVNTAVQGNYTVTYNVTDSDANTATQVTRSVVVGVFAQGSNFSMLTPTGTTFGGTNDVVIEWDGSFNTDVTDTDFSKMRIYSVLPQPFLGPVWYAHHIRVFNTPGTYTFDTTCTVAQLDAGTTVCNNLPLVFPQIQQFLTMTVLPGQIGVHMLFDWSVNTNIDVVNVWDQNAVWNDPDGTAGVTNNLHMGEAGCAPVATTTWDLVSTDPDGDGINGVPMVDGPFIGFNATFNANPAESDCSEQVIVIVAPDTKLGSGSLSIGMLLTSLFSLIGFGVYRKVKP